MKVQLNFGPSTALLQQISKGTPVDVFASTYQGIEIHELLAFADGQPVTEDLNLNAEVALYRLGRMAKRGV